MEMTEIRKDSIGICDTINEQVTSLAATAKAILGYDLLHKLVGKLGAYELTPLQLALRSLEIEVLRSDDVLRYQKERLVEETARLAKAWMEEVGTKDKIHSFDRFTGPSWVRTKIQEYKQPMPEFVLAKAVQVKEAFPECQIWIQSLEQHPDPFLVVGIPDGSYEWSEPKEQYHIEVWAEPKFEGRL